MSEPELNRGCIGPATAKLLAIVSVEHADRVRCGQPSCGHSVYRRIHVVREGGDLLVLGSTCFEKRYGGESALGRARFGGGEGRPLTDAERQLLVSNTEALLARFEEEYEARLASETVLSPPVASLARPIPGASNGFPRSGDRQETPWAWVKPWSSVIYLKLRDGSGWIRAQRKDDKQLIVPWPVFEGWDEALPTSFGPI